MEWIMTTTCPAPENIRTGAALKGVLRDAYTRTNQLLAALKKQKKQSQAVQATLASLRQLQHIDG